VIVKLNTNSPFFLFLFITTFSRTFTQIYIQMHVAKYVLGEIHGRLKLVYLIQFVLAMRSMETWHLPYNNTITDFVYEKRSPRLCCCTSVSVIILQQNIKTTDKHDDACSGFSFSHYTNSTPVLL